MNAIEINIIGATIFFIQITIFLFWCWWDKIKKKKNVEFYAYLFKEFVKDNGNGTS